MTPRPLQRPSRPSRCRVGSSCAFCTRSQRVVSPHSRQKDRLYATASGRFAAQPLKRDLVFIHSHPQIRQISLALFAAVDPTSPHGYYCTRNTPIRSQTTIQPRAGARGGNRTQDASKQPFPEGLLRLLCLVKRAAHYKTASEGSTRHFSTRQFRQPPDRWTYLGRDRPRHARCSRDGVREGRAHLTPGCQSPRETRRYSGDPFQKPACHHA